MQVLLVHSPLLARSSWGGVPARLAELGYAVAVPNLRPVLDSGPPFYERLFQAIAEPADGQEAVAVVGHSRAGPLLPGALAKMGPNRATAVFLDARLPHDGRTWLETLTADRRCALLASVENGLLPPWDRWFPPEAMDEVLPDKAVPQRFRDELRGMPAGLLSEPMPRSPWDERVGKTYVQLSAAYAAVADQALAAGWPVARYSMNHLAPLTHPREVADAIADSLTAAGTAAGNGRR
ncbi:alpha/beta fold hydrolase [Phytohabitans rumicis]|uniref:AB hydrolase-1 domain-containing protein n=1 Tax=Phytohabitans rumicis TaxID=1076125 RepID=A0A6V8LEW9_9ACTN|nr:alpha/beta fold hydrolase [Phytohabitans rumicis]GFJ93508.1 hypothetical protein Prum_071500 [Phytohabitans rumicis]